jgi:hypothetical protein
MDNFTEFYRKMSQLKALRQHILSDILASKTISNSQIEQLHAVKLKLNSIPKQSDLFLLKTESDSVVKIELDYELEELKKDEMFLSNSYEGLGSCLSAKDKKFDSEIEQGLNFLNSINFDFFFTDRDGTVNNYCGRYLSSVQGISNALILHGFSKVIKEHSIIITAAPLQNGGLVDVSIQPQDDFILAASKAREYYDYKGNYNSLPIESDKQVILDKLYLKLKTLLSQKEYLVFNYIGSGLQQKFGEITLARQDKNNSITEEQSLHFKDKVVECIKEVDPKDEFLALDDTGKDLEINLTIDGKKANEFNKGYGLKFVVNSLDLNLPNKKVLICGDTFSDIPMLTAAKELEADVYTIFVTEDNELKTKVKHICSNSFFVSSPDTLVFLLHKFTTKA